MGRFADEVPLDLRALPQAFERVFLHGQIDVLLRIGWETFNHTLLGRHDLERSSLRFQFVNSIALFFGRGTDQEHTSQRDTFLWPFFAGKLTFVQILG